MQDICPIRMNIVLVKLNNEGMEIAALSLREIESSLRAKQVVLKMLNASGTTFETLSAPPGAERLGTMEE